MFSVTLDRPEANRNWSSLFGIQSRALVERGLTDDGSINGRGKFAAWRSLIGRLDAVDRGVLSSAGDLPGRTVNDLLKTVAILRDHGVGLYLHS
jgi:hypothetical protein